MAGVRSNKGEINTDGYEYQLYTLLHCICRLRKHQNVRDYDVGNALIGFGALDDVVFKVTLESEQKFTTAIQVKHSNTKNMIDERYLCQNSRTCVYKYFDSFLNIKKTTALEQLEELILWTNMPIAENIRDWFERYVPVSDKNDVLGEGSNEGLSYKRYKIKSNYRQKIVQNYQGHMLKENEKDASRTRKRKDVCEPSEEEWEQFFERFVLYVNVPKVIELKTTLVRKIGNHFDCVCKLVESCAVKQIATSRQIDGLFTLINLRNSMETGPYTKLIFNDLDELQCQVQALFDDEQINLLRIEASQNIDCTVARLITTVKNCLAADNQSYLTFSYETFNAKWSELQLIMSDSKLIKKGLKCFIISYITDEEVNNVQKQLSALKVICVGKGFKSHDVNKLNKIDSNCDDILNFQILDDQFNINSLDNITKDSIKHKKIRLSQWQSATAIDIFCEKLFQKENYSLVLELHTLHKDSVLQITVNEPSVDIHYLSRITKLSSVQDSTTIVDLLNQNDFYKLVICDQPGMGKSTEMVKLASDFRVKYQDHLVVYLHCKEAVSKWSGSVVDLIRNTVTTCGKLTDHIVERIIQLGKVILIMDGFDEVSQKYNKTLKKLIVEVSYINVFKLYVATRPQCKDEINSILKKCCICHLEPFSENDQLAYLKKFWDIEKVNEETQALVDANARCIIHQFRSMMNGSSLIGIPLQTNMIAVIYKNRILCPDFKISESHTLAFMYKEFVELKFMEYIKRHFDPTNAAHAEAIQNLKEIFLHDHVRAAHKMYLNKSHPADVLCKRIQHYGLVITSPRVTFIHQTYLEYFLALNLLTYSMEISITKVFLIMFVGFLFKAEKKLSSFAEQSTIWNRHEEKVVRISGSLIWRFMDYLLNHIDPTVDLNRSLYKPIYTNENSAGYIPPKTARLHPDKMIEFNAVLSDINATTINLLFACLISDRLFNILEVIYDSLKPQVRLCLYNFCEEHSQNLYFCLKDIKNVDILISLLKILLNKNTDTFITLHLTSVSSQEKTILELMCNQDFSKLFEWFTEIFPNLNKEQQISFKRTIEKRLDACVLEIIKSNNVELLKKVIFLIQKTCTTATTNRFLTSKNLLRLFTEYIEINIFEWAFGSDLKKSVESIRIEMMHSVYDLYRWAFDEQIPLDNDFRNAVQIVKTTSIRLAFETTFELQHCRTKNRHSLRNVFNQLETSHPPNSTTDVSKPVELEPRTSDFYFDSEFDSDSVSNTDLRSDSPILTISDSLILSTAVSSILKTTDCEPNSDVDPYSKEVYFLPYSYKNTN